MKQLITKLSNYLDTFYIYQWCKDNSVTAHILLSILLSMSFTVGKIWLSWQLALIASFLFSSMFYFGKEYFDRDRPNGTGFDWEDIKVDYVAYAIGIFIQFLFSVINVYRVI